MENEFILECRDVGFSYPNGKEIFSQVALGVEPGSFVEIRGPSGAGKSTFLRLLNRLATPSRGSILYQGRNLADYSPPKLRGEISYLQQTPVLIQGSVRDNLLLPFGLDSNKERPLPDDNMLREGLSRFILDGVKLDNPAYSLSVGQRQRLCFFRAILLSPRILLLDEPTSALDPESKQAVEQIVDHLCQEHQITIFLVAHTDFKVNAPNARICNLAHGRMEVQ